MCYIYQLKNAGDVGNNTTDTSFFINHYKTIHKFAGNEQTSDFNC